MESYESLILFSLLGNAVLLVLLLGSVLICVLTKKTGRKRGRKPKTLSSLSIEEIRDQFEARYDPLDENLFDVYCKLCNRKCEPINSGWCCTHCATRCLACRKCPTLKIFPRPAQLATHNQHYHRTEDPFVVVRVTSGGKEEEEDMSVLQSTMEVEEEESTLTQDVTVEDVSTEELASLLEEDLNGDDEDGEIEVVVQNKNRVSWLEDPVICVSMDKKAIPLNRRKAVLNVPRSQQELQRLLNTKKLPKEFKELGPYPSRSWLDFHL